jgi:predicted component of viral defense system (DUF524 family)
MPDILKIRSSIFTLSVWAKDVERSQKRYSRTLLARGCPQEIVAIKFKPQLKSADVFEMEHEFKNLHDLNEIELSSPIFFENKAYEFDFDFSNSDAIPKGVNHPLKSVEDSFRVVGKSIRGVVNFGNDIGWFRLGIVFDQGLLEIKQYISFEVYPTKLVMHSDLKEMHKKIDVEYPLWTLSFARKTEHLFGRVKKSQPRFDIVWLANFSSLRNDLETAIKRVAVNPHSRLMPYSRKVPLEKITSKISTKLEEKIGEDIAGKFFNKLYRVEKKKLSFDTPENQFLKMVLTKTSSELSKFQERLKENSWDESEGAISGSFLAEIASWRNPLEAFLARPFLSEVSDFSGLIGESLVLQQQAGYAKVYQIWQELKLYLDLFSGITTMSLKSVADLYEVWCLLEIRSQLLLLGFEDVGLSGKKIVTKGLEKGFSLSHFSAFSLKRGDGVVINIYHEPTFKAPASRNQEGIFSFTTKQIPDIFLEVIFSTGEKVCWIFDAKYRISDDADGQDLIPEDAINQMHRYRDALIRLFEEQSFEASNKSRPIYGAYVLYPGWFDQSEGNNPYERSNLDVGIGGFPLVPGRHNTWLSNFFKSIFGDLGGDLDPDRYFLEGPLRIGPTGSKLSRYTDLTLALNLNGLEELIPFNPDQFKDGTSIEVFIPFDTFHNLSINSSASIFEELRYLAFAVTKDGAPSSKIDSLYLIRHSKYSRREDNTRGILFLIDFHLPLPAPILVSNQSDLKGFYTDATEILSGFIWDRLAKRYP